MTDHPTQNLTIRQVAQLANVSTNAVRYYERHAIVTASRTAGNARRFTIDAVCRIKLAVAAQRVGLTLADSAQILGDIPSMCDDVAVWQAATQRLVTAGQERIAELREVVEQYSGTDFIKT